MLLDALDEIEDVRIVFTKSNADTGGKVINQMIDRGIVTIEVLTWDQYFDAQGPY